MCSGVDVVGESKSQDPGHYSPSKGARRSFATGQLPRPLGGGLQISMAFARQKLMP